MHNIEFVEEKRKEKAKGRGLKWDMVNTMETHGHLRVPVSSDLYSLWVLPGWLCWAIHVSGSWVFVCSPLLLPLFFLELCYLTMQPTASL